MKKIVLSLFALSFSISIYAQEYTSYSKVIQMEGKSISEIHQVINEWIALSYNSAQNVIQLNTEEKIIIKAKSSIEYKFINQYEPLLYYLSYTITIAIREGRFKFDVNYQDFKRNTLPEYQMYNLIDVLSPTKSMNAILENYRQWMATYGFKPKLIEKEIKLKGGIETIYQDYVNLSELAKQKPITLLNSIESYVNNPSNEEDDW